MEFMLDSANLAELQHGCEYYPVDGITTNPSILKAEIPINYFEHLKAIQEIAGTGTFHVQLGEMTFEKMVEEYDDIESFDILTTEPFEDDVIMECDTDHLVKEFLDLRENLFLREGIDIWRLLELSLYYGDRIAIRQFAERIRDLGYTDFFAYLLQSDKAVKKIKETLS